MTSDKRPPARTGARPARRAMAVRRSDLESRQQLRKLGSAAGVIALLLVIFMVVSGFGHSDGPRSTGPSASPNPLIGGVGASIAPAGSHVADGSPGPSGTPDEGASGTPTDHPTDTPTGTGSPTDAPSPSDPASGEPSPSPTETPPSTGPPPKGSAPTGPKGFAQRKTVMPMVFPFARSVSYRYRDNYLEARAGLPEWYNHWWRRNPNGTIQRAHDGVDIFARRGTHVIAPISGTVIDPKTRWSPWRSDRYGRVVVIESDEATSVGYVVILAHLDLAVVPYGAHVTRGQYVGNVGDTGNAEGTPQLHFEVRAPFTFAVTELGKKRQIDAFSPYPSLRRADPKAHRGDVTAGPVVAFGPQPDVARTKVLWQVL